MQIIENIFKVLDRYGFLFIKGTGMTLAFSFIAVLGGVFFGMILTAMKSSKKIKIGNFRPLSFIATAYVEIIRGTPILLQLYVFYLWLPDALPFLNLTKFGSISLALIFNSAAYVSEVIRAGIEAVDIGQTEAARSLGLNEAQTMIKIIIPQAIKNVLPALCNEFIMMVKETALASTFFAGDIMTQYKVVNGALFLVIEPLIIIGAIYFLLTFTLSKIVGIFERRLSDCD
ncbi:MAG: amino acid ABC transporter permease [Oscillospiraceae bacterium]